MKPKLAVCLKTAKSLVQIFPKMDFVVGIFKDLTPDSEWNLPRYHMCQFSVKTDNFDFFGPNFPENEFWVKILKIYLQTWNQVLQDTMSANY